MLYFLILTYILSNIISADSADLLKKANKIKACEVSRILLTLLILLMARRLDFTGFLAIAVSILLRKFKNQGLLFLLLLKFFAFIIKVA